MCIFIFSPPLDGDEENVQNAKGVLLPIATKWCEKWDADGTDRKLNFFYTGNNEDEEDVVERVRGFAHLPAGNPLLVLLDIPNQCKYFSGESEITAEVVSKMIEDYLNKSLESQSLS